MQLDIYLLSQKWKELVKKARSKQLQPNEYNSGLFLITDENRFFFVYRLLFMYLGFLVCRDLYIIQSWYVWGGQI